MSVIVGQLFGPSHEFSQANLANIWTGRVALERWQPKCQLYREHDRSLRPIGELIHVQDGREGTWCVFSIDDPTYREVDERKYLSAEFHRSHATSAVGRKIIYTDVILLGVSLVDSPASWQNTAVQIDARDPRDGEGGHSYTTSGNHRRVLDRAWHHYRSHPAMRAADHVITADPARPDPVIRKRTGAQVLAEAFAKRDAAADQALAEASAKRQFAADRATAEARVSAKRRAAAGIDTSVPAELVGSGVVHRRTWDHSGKLIAASAAPR